jgi:hypothetical protein
VKVIVIALLLSQASTALADERVSVAGTILLITGGGVALVGGIILGAERGQMNAVGTGGAAVLGTGIGFVGIGIFLEALSGGRSRGPHLPYPVHIRWGRPQYWGDGEERHRIAALEPVIRSARMRTIALLALIALGCEPSGTYGSGYSPAIHTSKIRATDPTVVVSCREGRSYSLICVGDRCFYQDSEGGSYDCAPMDCRSYTPPALRTWCTSLPVEHKLPASP